MKKIFIVLFLFVSILLSSCSYTTEELDESYEKGYKSGYETGYSDAASEYESNYDLAYDDGYYAGAIYTCLFFGDIDRAFKCAINGCSWSEFVNYYDELVDDIFDNDEEEAEIFWSLISLLVSKNPSADDIELLTSKFGNELFIRNGVSFNK